MMPKCPLLPLIFMSTLIISKSQYNLYYSDPISENDLHFDCLHYKVSDDIASHTVLGSFPRNSHQIIPYCMRPSITTNSQHATILRSSSSFNIPFETLKNLNVTTKDLLSWVAPMDLAERYQSYLDSSNFILTDEVFHNCTAPWFGSLCQYTFDSNEPIADIVRKTFIAKQNGTNPVPISDITNLTCYVHIDCNRGRAPLCLDWREVCNGEIDCLNDGIDEKHCLQLEINGCEANEYRCHNGLCIDQQFINDDPDNPDCLDRTDENDDTNQKFQRVLGYDRCFMDPAFRCEDSDQYFDYRGFSCGDGQRIPSIIPDETKIFSTKYQANCANNRDNLLLSSILHDAQGSARLSLECKLVIACLVVGTHLADCIKAFCEGGRLPCTIHIDKVCNGSKYAILSVLPTIQNYVQFGYWTNKAIIYESFERTPLPDFLCYNAQRCPFLSTDFTLNNLACSNIASTGLVDVKLMIVISHMCSSFDEVGNETHCFHSQLFHCSNSTKCISKHRLRDGVLDCLMGDDETYNKTCELDHPHRFRCLSEENKCISPVALRDFDKHCRDGEDELFSDKRKLPFQSFCDGYTHLPVGLEKDQNETDETHCEKWPCNNPYTRCDGVWTCNNGADEVNCDPTSPCYPDQHECVSPLTFNVTCLSINRTGDGRIDCLGATDEKELCRRQYPEQPLVRYQCWNETLCTVVACFGVDACSFERHHSLIEKCQKNPRLVEIFGSLANDVRLGSVFGRYNKYFMLDSTIRFRSNRLSTPPIMAYRTTRTAPKDIDFQQAWICNRGILIYLGVQKAKYCLCPASYYRHRCEFQHERVSLTLQFRKECAPICLGAYGIILMNN